jgi:PhnB protein
MTGTRIQTVPDGYGTVTPWIIAKDTPALLDFLARAFDATELARVPNDDGSIGHAEVRIGDSVVMMFDGHPSWPDTPAFLRLYVEDGEATFRQAIAAGATEVTRMTEMFWGDLGGRVRDPFGNVWWIQQRLAEYTPEEMAERATRPEFVEAMRYVQGAQIVEPAR